MKNRSAVEILVVEDSAIQAEVLRRKLVREGYQVAVAENGAQALAKVRKTKFALVIQVLPLNPEVMAQEYGYKVSLKVSINRIFL